MSKTKDKVIDNLNSNREMSKVRCFVIGLHLYVFPPEPEIGDIKTLKNWKPEKKSIWETLKFRYHTGIWSYTVRNEPILGDNEHE